MKIQSETGKRIKLLRNMMGLSVLELSDKLRLSSKLLFAWEQEYFGGLTPGGAKNLVTLARKMGVVCDLTWLVEGVGRRPYFAENQDVVPQDEIINGLNVHELHQEIERVVKKWQENPVPEPVSMQLSMKKIGYFMPTGSFAEFYSTPIEPDNQLLDDHEDNPT